MNTQILGFIVANGPKVFKALLSLYLDKQLKADLDALKANHDDVASFVAFLREVTNDLGLAPLVPIGNPPPLSAP